MDKDDDDDEEVDDDDVKEKNVEAVVRGDSSSPISINCGRREEQYRTRLDTRPISSRWRVGRGSKLRGRGS